MFSQYCYKPFTVEPVEIIYENDMASSYISPRLDPLMFATRQSYVNSVTGLSLTRHETMGLLEKMGHRPSIQPSTDRQPINTSTSLVLQQASPDDLIHVLIPPTRPDILHECDLVEDVAIAYGFNNLKKTFPNTNTVAKPYPINKLSDIIRKECAFAGWLEVLPLTLCSHDENFKFLRKEDNKQQAVVLSNPATIEFQVVRTSLIPGLLKTIRENRKHPLPMKVFEVSDVVLKDDNMERKARNVRRVGVVYVGKKSAGFEIVHGLLDRLMAMLEINWAGHSTDPSLEASKRGQYRIEESACPTFFPGRSARIIFKPVVEENVDNKSSQDLVHVDQWIEIGQLGILHPDVLKNFDLDFPCSCFEFDVSQFL